MHEVKAIIRPERVAAVVRALKEVSEMPAITVSAVSGFGPPTSNVALPPVAYGETAMVKLEVVVPEALLDWVVETVVEIAATGRSGDGKVFVSRVEEAIKIRSGTRGEDAL